MSVLVSKHMFKHRYWQGLAAGTPGKESCSAAPILMAYVVTAHIVMAYRVMAHLFKKAAGPPHILMAHVDMAYIVTAHIVMPLVLQKHRPITYGLCEAFVSTDGTKNSEGLLGPHPLLSTLSIHCTVTDSPSPLKGNQPTYTRPTQLWRTWSWLI